MGSISDITVVSVTENGAWDYTLNESGGPDQEWSFDANGSESKHNPVWEVIDSNNTATGLGQGDDPTIPLIFQRTLYLKVYFYYRTMQYDEYMVPQGFGPWSPSSANSNTFYVIPDATLSFISTPSEITVNKQYFITFTLNESTPGSVAPIVKITPGADAILISNPDPSGFYWNPNYGFGGANIIPNGDPIQLTIQDTYVNTISDVTGDIDIKGIKHNSVTGYIDYQTSFPGGLGVGEVYSVTWYSDPSITNVDIYITLNGDDDSPISVATNITNDGEYSWTVPNNPSQQVKMFIQDHNDNTVYDFSDYFAINASKIKIDNISSIDAGDNYNITWTTYGSIPNVTIKYRSFASFTTWIDEITIATNVSNTDSYTWNSVPDLDSDAGAVIRIYDATNEEIYYQSNIFDLNGTTRFLLEVVGDGDFTSKSRLNNTTYLFSPQATHSYSSGAVDVRASTDNGATYPTILANNVSIGSASSNSFNDYNSIKIVSDSTPSVFGEIPITLEQVIVNIWKGVTSSLDLQDIVIGTLPAFFLLRSSTFGNNYDLLLSTDGGSTYPTTIINNGTGNGITWTVPNLPTSNARLKVQKHSDVGLYTESEIFSIVTGPIIQIFTDLTGTTQTSETNISIYFTLQKNGGGGDNVDIYLSTDGGSTYPTTIVNNYSITSNASWSYNWNVNSVSSDNVKLKIAKNSNNAIYAETGVFTILNTTPILVTPTNEEDLVIGDRYHVEWNMVDIFPGGSSGANLYMLFNEDTNFTNDYVSYMKIGTFFNLGRTDWIIQGFESSEAKLVIVLNNGNNLNSVSLPNLINDTEDVNIVLASGNSDPTVDQNNTFTILQKQRNKIITNSFLNVVDDEQTADDIVYTVTSVPTRGVLTKNNVALVVSNTFTQDDIDNNLIKYSHTSGSLDPVDDFKFTVSDGNGGSIDETTFNISIKLTSLGLNIISRLLKFKT